MRIRENMLDQPIASLGLGVGQSIKRKTPLRILDLMMKIALLFVTKAFTISDQELEIARIRLIHSGIIDFINDAVTNSEPKPAARMIRGA